MKTAVVIPTGVGRMDNLVQVLSCLARQTVQPALVVVVQDGHEEPVPPVYEGLIVMRLPKHQPGMAQPRNLGVRLARQYIRDLTHVAFLDSDVVVHDDWLETIQDAYADDPDRVMVCPYEWLPDGIRPGRTPNFWQEVQKIYTDQRWAMFNGSPRDKVYHSDLSAGLACWSGNLVWPIAEFLRVGGFWQEIHHGRCEDGELGLRAVAMGVGISFCAQARGYHLDHPTNMAWKLAANERDVPMLNARHPWVQQGGVFMVDRDGKAFDALCPGCGAVVSTGLWWDHAETCPSGNMGLPVEGVECR
jgi:GT2 family glycosyltransferase